MKLIWEMRIRSIVMSGKLGFDGVCMTLPDIKIHRISISNQNSMKFDLQSPKSDLRSRFDGVCLGDQETMNFHVWKTEFDEICLEAQDTMNLNVWKIRIRWI